MQRFYFLSSVVSILLISSLVLGCTVETATAQGNGPTPTPKPPPKCQQDNLAMEIGKRMLFSPDRKHYTQVIADPGDARVERILTDGNQIEIRFDKDKVGPIVFHPKSDRFAFTAKIGGNQYVLEYANGARTPQTVRLVQETWKNWVCYGSEGKYLFAIARENEQWNLLTRNQQASSAFVPYPLVGIPSDLELLPKRADGSEGVQYNIQHGAMNMEIKSWLK